MALGDRIRSLREARGWTQLELGERLQVSDKAVSTWENNVKSPRLKTIAQIARLFDVPMAFLVGGEQPASVSPSFSPDLERLCTARSKTPLQVSRELSIPWERFLSFLRGEERPSETELDAFCRYFQVPPSVFKQPDGDGVSPVHPIEEETGVGRRLSLSQPAPHYGKIPVLGRIPAGVPVEAAEDIIDYIDLPDRFARSGYSFFALLVTGNSMYPEYMDGDVVIVRQQDAADTGDDVVAYIGGYDATLKRLTVTPRGIQLRPLNPAYEVRSFSEEEIRRLPVNIAGVVVEQRRRRKN